MKYQKQLLRASFFLFLLTCLLTGLAGTARLPARAAPQMQTALSVVINEIAWGGTQASANAEWIELYNPGATDINLGGWTLSSITDGSPNIALSGTIVAGGYYLLERSADTTISDITADLIYTGGLNNTGETLELRDNANTLIDTANQGSGTWFAGTSSPGFYSMERKDVIPDSALAWATNNGIVRNGLDGAPIPNPINGTPKQINSATLVLTPTITPLVTDTPTSTNTSVTPSASIVISEFRTTGPNGGNDEFIELYNPTASPVPIGNWTMNKSSGCGSTVTIIATIPSAVTLASGQHYLIGGSTYSGSVTPDLPNTSLNIADNGGIALLQGTTVVDQVGLCATTLYFEGTPLTPLTTSADRSYDRRANASGNCVDTNNNATDFISRNPSDPHNLSSPLTNCGNPTPTPTVTRTPTRTRTPTSQPTITRTPTPLPPPPLIAINEFVPRPGHDWNNDGIVNVGDEYIELLNHGVVDVNLSGWSLDDEVNIGSSPYRLPAITLSPGERIVFYGKDTGLLLSDGGDGVRLLKPNGQLADAFNYRVVRYPDQAYCRYPDDGGADDWTPNCFPTPGLRNSLSGSFVNPPNRVEVAPVCPIADTLPLDFVLAECPPFGERIFRPAYWDKTGWYGERYLPKSSGKWSVFVD